MDPFEIGMGEDAPSPVVFFETPKRMRAGPGEVLIDLSRGYQVLIDRVDLGLLQGRSFYAHHSQSNVYARNRSLGFLHTLICKAEPGWVTDHLNRNALDCRRNNLRVAGFDRNAQNVDYMASKSGFRGVTLEGRKFRARISTNGEQQYLGLYGTAEEAARVYDHAALTIYGEYAWTNFSRDLSPKELLVEDDIPF